MDDMLKYAVNFDLEQGLKQAQEDWKKVDKQLQAMVSDKGFKIKLFAEDDTSQTISKVREEMSKLVLEWNNLSKASKFDADGQFSEKANQIIQQYYKLTDGALTYGKTLQQITKEARKGVDEEIAQVNKQIEANKKLFESQRQGNFERGKKGDTSDLEYQKLKLQYAEKEYAQNRKIAQANSELYAQKQQQKQVAEQEYELLKAKYRLQEQDQEAKQRQRNIDLANKQNQIEQANYNKIRSAGLSKQKILQAEENSLAAINAKLAIQKQRLSVAEFGSAKFTKINAEIQRLTASYDRHTKVTNSLDAAQRRATATTHAQTSAYSKQVGMLDSLKRSFAAYTGMFATMQLVRSIASITAQFEMQKVALGAIIQDTNKAELLFSQIKAASLESPFRVKELVSYTKQLSAYRVETEQLFETTMRLADISAGLGVEMDRLVLAYGQVKAASVLRGQELRQFTEAGIPLVQLLAEKFTKLNGQVVTTGEVFDLISNRAVSFGMIKEIFEDMTNAGGTFYEMQKIQSKTLQGSWSNLKDAMDIAFSEMGNSQMEFMKGSIDVTRTLLKNWEDVWTAIQGLIGTYTAYKVALMLTGNATKALAIENALLAKSSALAAAGHFKAANAMGLASQATNVFSRTLWKLYAAYLANPIAAWTALILGAGYAIYKLVSHKSELEKVNAELSKISLDNLTNAQQLSSDFGTLAKAILTSTDGSKQQKEALEELQRTFKDYLPTQALTIQGLREMKGNYDAVTEAIYAKIAAQNKEMLLSKVNEKLGAEVQEEMEDFIKGIEKGLGLSTSSLNKFVAEVRQEITKGNISLKEGADETAKKVAEIAKKYGAKGNEFMFGKGVVLTDSGLQVKSLSSDLVSFIESINDYNQALKNVEEQNSTTFSDFPTYDTNIKDLEKGFADLTLSMKANGKALSQDEIKLKIGEFDYDEQVNQFKIWQYKNWLKKQFEKEGISVSVDDFIQWQGKLGTPFADQIPADIRKALDAFTNESPALFKAAQSIQNKIGDILGSPQQQQLVQRFREIAQQTGVSMDFARNYLKDNETSWSDWSKKIKDAISQANQSIKVFSYFGDKGQVVQQQSYLKFLNALNIESEKLIAEETKKPKVKDTRADRLKEEISLVETAYKAYQELEKQIGSAAAKKAIEKQFGGQTKTLALAFSDEALIAELKKAQDKAKTKADKIAIGVKIDKVSFDALMEDLKKKMDDVKTLIDNEKQKINFYDTIFEKTGREDLAKLFTQNIYGGLGDLQKILRDQIDAVFVNPMKATGVDMTEFTKSISEATKGAKIDYIALQKLIPQLAKEAQKNAEEVVKSGIESNAKIIEDLMESLKETESFEKKKTDIIQKGIKERELLTSQGLPETDAAFVQSIKKQEEALASLSFEQLKSSELWLMIFDNLDKVSKTSLDKLIAQLENLLKTQGKDMDLKEMKEAIKALNDLKQASSGKNPFKAVVDGLKEYIAAQIEYQKYRSSGIEDAEKENEILAKLTTAREKVAKGYEAVTKVVGQLKSLMDGFIDLLGITEDSEAGQVMLEFSKALGFVATALGVVATMAVIAETALAPLLLPILAISAAVAGLIALGKWFAGADTRKANKEIKKQEQILDNLKEKYEALEKAQEDAFGKEYLQNYQQQLKNLQAQQVAYEKQAAAEKKKGKDEDKDATAEALANAKAAAEDAAELQKQLLERFTGTDLTSFARDFAKAWLDAYIEVGRTGANTTNELKKKWKDLVKNMIVEGMLAAAVQGAFKGIFDKITALYETGKIPTAEQLNSFNQEGFGIIDMLGTTLPQLLEGLDLSALGDSVSGLSGLAKGIEGITEQQANVLSAAINTQNYYIIDIWTLLKKWDADRSGGGVTLGSLITIQNTYLQELPIIRQNTQETAIECKRAANACESAANILSSVIYPINGKKAVNTTMS